LIWFVTKIFLRGLLILAGLIALLCLLLASESVNRWIFERAMGVEPRLELVLNSGHLWRGWNFERIAWQDQALQVVVDDVDLSWSPGCLSAGKLCINHLDIAEIRVNVLPAEEEPPTERQPIVLPDLDLPLDIQLERLQIGSVWLDDDAPLLTRVLLSADVIDNQLVINEFTGIGPDVDWSLDGRVQLFGEWPLQIRSDITLPAVNERELNVGLELGGTAAEMTVQARTSGYIDGRLDASVEPLDPSLPLRLEWQSEPFLALSTLPETLTLEAFTLILRGNLDQGYALQADGSLPGEGGEIDLSLAALIRETGLSDLDLKLLVKDEPERYLALTGGAAWGEELAANVQLDLQRFPWQWLYPQDLGEIELEQLQVEATLQGMDFTSDIDGTISGIAGQRVTIDMAVAGNPESITIAPLMLETEAGRASGEVMLALDEGVEWDVQLLLEQLDPGIFVADLPGDLNGPITSTGSLLDGELQLAANWDVEGTLRERPLELSGALAKQAQAWEFSNLQLRQGANRISGDGEWGEQIAADLAIQLTDLETLWPGLTGQLVGKVTAGGNAQAPAITANLQGERIGYEEMGLDSLDVQGRVELTDTLPGNLTVSASRLRSGETYFGNLMLEIDGDRDAHNLLVDLQNGIVELSTRLSGSLNDERWLGQLTDGQVTSQDMTWRLVESASIAYRLPTGALSLGEHCWTHEGGRLCFNGDQQLMPDRQLALTLEDFPLTSLENFLPEDFAWAGTLDADVSFAQPEGSKPTAEITVSSLDGILSVSSPEQTLEFPYSRLELNSQLTPDEARNRLILAGETLGELEIQADVADPTGEQSLSGQYRLDGFQLDFIRPFLPGVEVVQGELNGNGLLSGVLTDPQIEGVVALQNGQISGPELPVSFDQLGVTVAIEGQSADIQGDWRSGEDGQGSLSGAITWAPELDISLALQGRSLPVTVPPYANLLVSPDLTVSMVDNQLRIRGELAIPEGDITVRELPEQAVKVSPDVVIVGDQEEAEEEAMPLDVSARVTLLIGDQLRFSGFGLTGRLSGQMEVREDMTASGDLNILDGRFRRFGQRLSLRQAQILFAGPISQPFLNIEAVRRVDEVLAGLRLTGRAESPQSEVFSEPAMPQEQALSYLVLGRPLGGDGGDNNMVGQAALALGMAGSGPLAQNIAGRLGIEDFQLETEGSGAGTQVVAAGYLTDKLSLRYGVGVFEPASQVGLRYDLTRRLYLEAVSGFASSLDFFYRIDF